MGAPPSNILLVLLKLIVNSARSAELKFQFSTLVCSAFHFIAFNTVKQENLKKTGYHNENISFIMWT